MKFKNIKLFSGLYKKYMYWTDLRRGIQYMEKVSGDVGSDFWSGVIVVFFGFLAALFMVGTWLVDLAPTFEFGSRTALFFGATGYLIPIFVVSVGVSPSILELVEPLFVKHGWYLISPLAIMAKMFDFVTDFPMIYAYVRTNGFNAFAVGGVLNFGYEVLFGVSAAVLTFFASIHVELFAILFAVLFYNCAKNFVGALRGRKVRYATR